MAEGKEVPSIVADWCEQHGYQEPFVLNGEWWAFPQRGVIPVCISQLLAESLQAEMHKNLGWFYIIL